MTGPSCWWRPTPSPRQPRTSSRGCSPGTIKVIGGTAMVSDGVLNALRGYATSGNVERIAGNNRYATAAAVSADTFTAGVPVAYIATGEMFPDALSGAGAAGMSGGPILLVRPDAIPAETASRAQPTRAWPDRGARRERCRIRRGGRRADSVRHQRQRHAARGQRSILRPRSRSRAARSPAARPSSWPPASTSRTRSAVDRWRAGCPGRCSWCPAHRCRPAWRPS